MKLVRLRADKPDFEKLYEMIRMMNELLEDSSNASLTLDELLAFQDTDGSFRLFVSYEVPADAAVDFCHVPTYIGTAILMKEYLNGKRYLVSELKKALLASLKCGFYGHGYDAEDGLINALKILSMAALGNFLKMNVKSVPDFIIKLII